MHEIDTGKAILCFDGRFSDVFHHGLPHGGRRHHIAHLQKGELTERRREGLLSLTFRTGIVLVPVPLEQMDEMKQFLDMLQAVDG